MASRTITTARQRRLGTELRRMRERAGLSIQEAASLIGTNRSHITNMELARFGVSEERLQALAHIYSCQDTAYIDALAAMTRDRKGGWWEEYRGLLAAGGLDLAELEYHAAGLRVIDVMYVPGLLQTEDYARAVLGHAVTDWSPSELRCRLSHRLRRRDILDRENSPRCTFIVHEAALLMKFGKPRVQSAQFDALLEASERENVDLRLVPFATGGFPLAGISVTHAQGAVPQLDTVQLDTGHGSEFFDSEAQLTGYGEIFDRTVCVALSDKESRDFIRSIARQTQDQG